MNNQETLVFCGAMAAVWPSFEVNQERVKILSLLLREIEVPAAMTALEVLANTYEGEFSPSIPTLMKTIRKVTESPADRLGAEEAFGLVLQAISRFGQYREPQALQSLPPKAAMAVKALGWKNICNTENDDLGTLRAHFYRTFDAVKKREADDRLLITNGPERVTHSELLRLVSGATRTMDASQGTPANAVTTRTTQKRRAV